MNEAAPASDPALMTAEEALAAAEAEGLTLLLADNATGFACVARLTPKGRAKPYKADVWEEGRAPNRGRSAARALWDRLEAPLESLASELVLECERVTTSCNCC
jgi:hypothetical protein